MRFVYGNYSHAENEALVSVPDVTPIFNKYNQQTGVKRTIEVEGMLHSDDGTQAGMTAAIVRLEQGYAQQGQSATMYDDAGAVAFGMPGARVVSGPAYPDGRDIYSLFRRYRIRLEAESYSSSDADIIAFEERFTPSGGGALDDWIESLIGMPQKQRLREATVYTMVQEGSAVGRTRYPDPTPPLWPADMILPRSTYPYYPKRRPETVMENGQLVQRNYEIQWRYEFRNASGFVV